MRICIISDLYYPYPGGVATHIYHTAEELRKLGHNVKILTTNYFMRFCATGYRANPSVGIRGASSGEREPICYELDGWSSSSVEEARLQDVRPRVDIIRVGKAIPFLMNASVSMLPMGFGLSGKVRKIIGRSPSADGFDILHLHTPYPVLPTLSLRYSRAINILTFHSGMPERWWNPYLASWLKPYARRVDGAIAVSFKALQTMRYFINVPRVAVIPNGIDIVHFSPDVAPLPKFTGDGPNILFVGRFDPRKGLKYLLQAFIEVRKKLPSARLIVVGRGLGKIPNPKSQIPNVYFEGFVSPKEMPRYYASCDVFCSPAIGGESFGIVLLEAMACSKPVVACDIPGYREVVRNGENGILVEPRNPSMLAQALIGVLTNKALRLKLERTGRETAIGYSWDKITKRIEAFYYEVIRGVR